ncbi:MAG: tRNA lysidine(34) synthetase TilS [Desulfuromonas sp.]|nr:tRNA lysidine(34) synthetase TilS [Desulfuromonas sp.]
MFKAKVKTSPDMPTLLRRFQHHLDATGMLSAGSCGLVAVSGGADSVALLHLLHKVAEGRRLKLHAAHLDHALRPDSPADAAHVRELCATLAVPLSVARIDIAALARGGKGGIEETAREARRTFLRETAQTHGCAWIALAHQRDDQAETFLLRLLRGAGTTGLAGMRPVDPPFVRPLLPFSRTELVEWLTGEGVAWREDASNQDPAFARNRVRHELLPLLESYNPAVRLRLSELCRQLADDEDDWAQRSAAELQRIAGLSEGECRLPCAALVEASPAMAGRLVRAALKHVRGDLRRLDADHVNAVIALARGARPQGALSLPGAWAGRRYGLLLLRRTPPRIVAQSPFEITGPGIYPLTGGGVLDVSLADKSHGEGRTAVEFCPRQVTFPLQVRVSRPGDRLHPEGMAGTKKLQDLFVDLKLSVEERTAAILVFGGEQLLWVAGVRRCAGLRPSPASGPVLRLELFGPTISQPQSA